MNRQLTTYKSILPVQTNPTTYEKLGIMGIDALHIACAEKSKSDFFVTCDDILVKKCKTNEKIIKLKVETLMKFVTEEVFKL